MSSLFVRIAAAIHLTVLGVTLATANGQVDLFDATGKSAATLDSDGHLIDSGGRVVGFLRGTNGPAAVYSTSGQQIGWFKAGAFHNLDGRVVWAVSSRHMIATEVPPVHSPVVVGPAALPVPDAPLAPPTLTNEFAPVTPHAGEARQPQRAANLVLPRLNSDASAREAVNDSLRIAQQNAEASAREHAVQQSAANFDEERLAHEAWMKAASQRMDRQREELGKQESEFRESEGQLRQAKAFAVAAERRQSFTRTVYGAPRGPVIAVRPIPEFGMVEGDVIRFGGTDSNGNTECTVQDMSLERSLFPTSSIPGYTVARIVEPIELIAVALETGRLRKLSEAEFEEHLKRGDAELAEAFELQVALATASGFRATQDMPSEWVRKGDVLRYRNAGPRGVLFSRSDGSATEIGLPPVPMRTLMGWIRTKKLEMVLEPAS